MKAWFIILTMTTWSNGNPQTDVIGPFKTQEECLTTQYQLKESYEKNYPEGIVNIIDIHCEKRKNDKL